MARDALVDDATQERGRAEPVVGENVVGRSVGAFAVEYRAGEVDVNQAYPAVLAEPEVRAAIARAVEAAEDRDARGAQLAVERAIGDRNIVVRKITRRLEQ